MAHLETEMRGWVVQRIIGLVVLAFVAFYVVWPAWTGYAIRAALQDQDAAGLAAKVDFDRVRESLRPVVARKVDEGVDRYQSQLGAAGGAIVGRLRQGLVPKVVDASLNRLLTPEAVIRIAAEAGPLKESLDRIMREQIGLGVPNGGVVTDSGSNGPAEPKGLGGLLGTVLKGAGSPSPAGSQAPAAPPPMGPAPERPKRKFSLANVKSFAVNGPLSFRVGVAKDPMTVEPDITAELAFTGGDWRVVGVVPRI
jgi:hypothetical protein